MPSSEDVQRYSAKLKADLMAGGKITDDQAEDLIALAIASGRHINHLTTRQWDAECARCVDEMYGNE